MLILTSDDLMLWQRLTRGKPKDHETNSVWRFCSCRRSTAWSLFPFYSSFTTTLVVFNFFHLDPSFISKLILPNAKQGSKKTVHQLFVMKQITKFGKLFLQTSRYHFYFEMDSVLVLNCFAPPFAPFLRTLLWSIIKNFLWAPLWSFPCILLHALLCISIFLNLTLSSIAAFVLFRTLTKSWLQLPPNQLSGTAPKLYDDAEQQQQR